jgi:hypothetical protein
LIQPFDQLFGHEHVFHKPALGSKFALRNLTTGKRFILWDDFRPVEYAQQTLPVVTFLSLFDGAPFEVQCSQSFHDGNFDFAFHGGAVMTAKEAGLWTPAGCVAEEDVRHMKSRVHVFRLTGRPAELRESPPCHVHMAKWISLRAVLADAAAALKSVFDPAAGRLTGSVDGWERAASAARLPKEACEAILQNLLNFGAVSVSEVEDHDWASMPAVMALKPLEKRRLLAAVRLL